MKRYLLCQKFNIQKTPSEITEYGVGPPNEIVFAGFPRIKPRIKRIKPENDPKIRNFFETLLQCFCRTFELFRGLEWCEPSTTTKRGFYWAL